MIDGELEDHDGKVAAGNFAWRQAGSVHQAHSGAKGSLHLSPRLLQEPGAFPRDVQAALRNDIRRLKAGLEFLNIALIPIIVAAVAIVLGALRLRRRSRRASEA